MTQSLSRTIITSVTTLLAVTAIYVFGTASIKTFALSLIIGVIIGTYSSVFVASPVLLVIREFNRKKNLRSNNSSISTHVSVSSERQKPDREENGQDPVSKDDSQGSSDIPSSSVKVVRKQPRRKKRSRR